jgi:uncharacterized protein (DUF362 family)
MNSPDNAARVPLDRVVALVESARADYGILAESVAAPEMRAGQVRTVAGLALRTLFRVWNLDSQRMGTAEWNPLGAIITAGSRVVLKPNWVVHENPGGDLDCMVTNTSIIDAVLEYVALARPGSVVLGDAPIQRCDFARLRQECALDPLVEKFQKRGLDLKLADFRRTVLSGDRSEVSRRENIRGSKDYVQFDLANDSLLEPLSMGSRFRVTVYNPDLLERTHARGRHQYLVAREVIDADTVINLPKLKSHKKACITGALKNLVGINGNKEFLPHHRKGGAASGGDCYAGSWWLKERAEELLDWANRRPVAAHYRMARVAEVMVRAAQSFGADGNLDGSWHGNDTIWRTCLDLQRLLRYGRADGSLSDRPQRQVVTITDAIVAGEGEGPLAPTPMASGFVTGALNPAAADWVHSRLMGFDPEKIPLVRQSFEKFRYSLTSFEPPEIVVRLEDGERAAGQIHPAGGRGFRPPAGWRDYCELNDHDDRANCESDLVA